MGQPITFNEKENRFEQVHGQSFVYANVHYDGEILCIDYVFAPPELRGTGAAGCIMGALMDKARAEGLKIRPICGYAATWLVRHKAEYGDLIAV